MNPENTVADVADAGWRRMASLVASLPASSVHVKQEYYGLVLRRFLFHNWVVFFLQYAGLLFTTLASTASPVWFAGGTGCAFIFLRGYQVVPGLWLGSLLAYHSAGLSVGRASLCALVLALQALLLVKLCYRSSILSLAFFQRSGFYLFLAYSAVVTSVASALLTLLCVPLLQHPSTYTTVFLEWWLANFNGSVLVSCALFTWDAFVPDLRKLKQAAKAKLALIFAAWILLSGFFLVSTALQELLLPALLLALSLALVGRIYRWCGVLAALFLLAFFMSVAAFFNMPLFFMQAPELTVGLEIFLALLMTTGMAAVV